MRIIYARAQIQSLHIYRGESASDFSNVIFSVCFGKLFKYIDKKWFFNWPFLYQCFIFSKFILERTVLSTRFPLLRWNCKISRLDNLDDIARPSLYAIIFLVKVSKDSDFVYGTAVTACVVKMHSPPREILRRAGVDGFSEGVPGEKGGRAGGRWRKSEDGCGSVREWWTLKLMIPREYPRRSTYHKSHVPRRRFFGSHPEFPALFFAPEQRHSLQLFHFYRVKCLIRYWFHKEKRKRNALFLTCDSSVNRVYAICVHDVMRLDMNHNYKAIIMPITQCAYFFGSGLYLDILLRKI